MTSEQPAQDVLACGLYDKQGLDVVNGESPSSFNFERVLPLLKRRGPIVILCLLIVAGSAYAFAKHEKKQYTATASLIFSDSQLGLVASGLNPNTQPATQSQQDTNVALVGLGNINSLTAKALGPHWSALLVKNAVAITASSDTSIVDVAATAKTPALAKKIANTYATTFVSEQQATTSSQLGAALKLVNAQIHQLSREQQLGPQGLALADRQQTLKILSGLDNGGVGIAGLAGLPASPSSPKVPRDLALGAALGLLLGLAIAFVLERLDRRIRDPKEFASLYDLPLLAVVPDRSDYKVLKSLGQAQQAGGRLSLYDEVFSLLRSYLRYFGVSRDLRTLLVVSAAPGEGKTTVCYNLAKAAAALGSRVLLIECDLRHATVLAPMVDLPEASLPDVLLGDTSMAEAICSVPVGSNAVLDVMVAGQNPPPNAGELMESQAMDALLEQVRTTYDFVVIDTPPMSIVADAIPLLKKVDGVIVVGRMGKSRRDTGEQLRAKLASVRAPVLGVVANGIRGSDPTGYGRRGRYGYGYGTYGTPPQIPEEPAPIEGVEVTDKPSSDRRSPGAKSPNGEPRDGKTPSSRRPESAAGVTTPGDSD